MSLNSQPCPEDHLCVFPWELGVRAKVPQRTVMSSDFESIVSGSCKG